MTHPDLNFWRRRARIWQGEARGGKDDRDASVQFHTHRPPRLWQEHQWRQSWPAALERLLARFQESQGENAGVKDFISVLLLYREHSSADRAVLAWGS